MAAKPRFAVCICTFRRRRGRNRHDVINGDVELVINGKNKNKNKKLENKRFTTINKWFYKSLYCTIRASVTFRRGCGEGKKKRKKKIEKYKYI